MSSVVCFTPVDILPKYHDVIVSVPAFVFVVKADGVHQFVNGCVVLETSVVQ